MPQGPFTRIVVRRPDGTIDVIGRKGSLDPNKTARTFNDAGHGEVLAVRHEMMPVAGKPQTMQIHPMKQ